MIESNTIAKGIIKGAIGLVILYLLYIGFSKIAEIFVYLIISLVLCLMLNPLIQFLKNKLKFKNLLAVITSFLLLFLLLFGLISMIVPLISSQSQSLSLLNPITIQDNILFSYNEIQRYLLTKGIDLSNLISADDIFSKFDFNFIPQILNNFLSILSSFGVGLFAVLFITFFFLKEMPTFIAGFKLILPEDKKERILNSLEKVNQLLSRYFIGLMLQLTIVFILCYIVLLFVGVNHAFTIAFVCALFNIIPYIGPLLGMIFASILTMISRIGSDFQTEVLPATLWVIFGFLIVQLIDNNVNQPLIFSNSVKSHPLEIFIIILIAGLLMGITGMIIAIPLYTIIKVFAKEFYSDNKIVWLLTRKL